MPTTAAKPNDELKDRPITFRAIEDAVERIKASTNDLISARRLVSELLDSVGQTDYVAVNFGNRLRRYTYKIAQQPARRVQVGDLVTVQPNAYSSQPQVARVIEVNVTKPRNSVEAKAVAISPEDAQRIESTLGRVR